MTTFVFKVFNDYFDLCSTCFIVSFALADVGYKTLETLILKEVMLLIVIHNEQSQFKQSHVDLLDSINFHSSFQNQFSFFSQMYQIILKQPLQFDQVSEIFCVSPLNSNDLTLKPIQNKVSSLYLSCFL